MKVARWWMLFFAVAAGVGWGSGVAQDHTTAPAEVTFQFERVGLPVPRYTITVKENGTAVYAGEESQVDQGVSEGRGPQAHSPVPLPRF